MPVFDTIRLEPSTGGVIAIPQESVQTSSEEAFRRLTFNGSEIVFVSGRNLGSGAKVFTGTNGSSDLILDFKSVRGGLGIAIEEDANHITITATGETAPFFPAVDEGVYTAPVITFDDQGRITSVVNGIAGGSTTASNLGGVGSIPVFVQKTGLDLRFRSLRASGIITLSSSGTEIQIGANAVTSIAAIGTGPITVTGSPVTSTGIFTIGIADSGVNAGVYANPTITVDAKGRVVAAAAGTSVSSVNAVGTGPITVTGGPVTSTGTFTISLADSGVAAGVYANAKVTVDAKGRVTGIESAPAVTSVGAAPVTVSNNPATGVFTIGIADSGVASGVYTNPTITVDAKGRVVAAAAGTAVTSVNAVGAGPVTVTGGPVTSTGTFTISLADSGVVAGQYTNPTVTVDVKGRVTGIESVPAVSSVGAAPITVASDPATGIFTIGIADSGVNAGVYANPTITVDAKGRVVAAAAGTAVTSVNAVGTGPITITGGPVTSTGTFTIALADSGAVAGQYTNPTITVDAKGRLTEVEAGTPVTSVGTAPITVASDPATGTFTIGIADSGVDAGVYANPTITVDAKGRVVAAAAGTAVTSVNAVGTGPITITGGPVTSTGTFTIALADSGAVAGQYTNPTVTIDAKGRVTGIESAPAVTSVGAAPVTVSSNPLTGTFTIGIADSGVNAGVYANPTITIDSKGRVVAAAAGTSVSSINAVGTGPITVTGGPVTSTGTFTIGIADSGVTAGVYANAKVTVDVKGRVTGIESAPAVTSVGTAPVTVSSNPATGTFTIGIADSGVNAGVYANPTITVDAKGRVTAAAGGSAVTSVAAAGQNGVIVTGSPITSSGTLTIGLSDTGAVAGQYTNPTVTIDAKGRVTAILPGNAVTSVAATGQNGIVVSGSPITSSGTLQVSLGNTGVVAGTYQAASVTVNAQGRITAVAANDLGEANTGTNIGAGRNVFASKQGTALQFRTLRGSTNIALTETATEIEIAALSNEEVVVLRYTEAGDFDGGDIIVSETENVATTIINAATGVVRFSFTGKTRPPSSIAVLGQDYASNNFVYQQATPAMNIAFAGGGTSEDPLLTSAITTADITLSQAVTGATSDSQERSRLVVIFKW